MTRRGILTIAIAVLGLALSAALAWSASQLAAQRIGLASEPLSVERGLAPQRTAVRPGAPSHADRGKRHVRPAPKQTAAPKPASTPASTAGQIFTTPTPAPTATVTSPPSAPSAPAAATSTAASTPASGGRSSAGAGGRRNDHRADD